MSYDHRQRGRPAGGRGRGRAGRHQPQEQQEDDHHHRDGRRSRSRSRSPVDDDVSSSNKKKARLEAERQARMARLRAENEQEEARLATLEEQQQQQARQPVHPSATEQIVQVDAAELEGLDEEEQMKLMLGFAGGFGSTKNSKVADNHETLAAGTVAKNKARKYRQYMNRKNGFNRPLDKMD